MAFWVFGYGSLLWNPGFEPVETVRATIHGYHRSFCMLSIHHRGTQDDPGLVLALDAAPSECMGLALKVHENAGDKVLAYLRDRELVSAAYVEKTVTLQLDDGREVPSLAYVMDPDHQQYCQFDLEKQAQMIAAAHGGRGPNAEYLYNTAASLAELKIPDPDMDWLVARVKQIENGA